MSGASADHKARRPRVGSGLTAVRHVIEYALLRTLVFVVDRLSWRSACAFVRLAARAWWRVDKPRQRVAVANILRAGIESDPGRALELSKRSAEHFGQVVIEGFKSREVLEAPDADQRCRLEIAPDVLEVLEDPSRGLIMASGHFGSWEIAAHRLSAWKPVAGITRKMNNPLAEGLVQKRKGQYRFRPIPKHAADPRRFLGVLENGEILALLMDQYAGKKGRMVPFFGHDASTFTTAAMLHLVTRQPLCFACCRRVGEGRFVLESSPLVDVPPSGKKKEDVARILSTLNGHLEDAIRRDPDQYLWGHRRWRD